MTAHAPDQASQSKQFTNAMQPKCLAQPSTEAIIAITRTCSTLAGTQDCATSWQLAARVV